MKERCRRRQLSTIVGILVTAALVLAILFMHGLMTAINTVLDISFMEYIEYVLFILVGIIIIRKWITEYEYVLVDDDLIVDRYIGKRSRRIFEVKISQIVFIGETLSADYKGKKQRLTFRSKRSGVVYIIFIKNDDKKCAMLSISQKMTKMIESRMTK